MIKIFITITGLGIPLSLVYLDFAYPEVKGRYLFTLFALFIMVERIWETFYTSKEKDIRQFHGDWTLLLTSFMYLIVGLIMIFEFFSMNRTLNIPVTILGIIIFLTSAGLRLFAVKTLGDQWAVHAIGKSKIKSDKHILIRRGPYRYIRHPIYLGIILELIGIALITNTFFALIFILLINAPLYILRAIYEEKTSIQRFGEDYLIYTNEVPFMVFLPLLKRGKLCK